MICFMKYIIMYSEVKERASESGREYRKGKQERDATPGNRIREIEKPQKPLDV